MRISLDFGSLVTALLCTAVFSMDSYSAAEHGFVTNARTSEVELPYSNNRVGYQVAQMKVEEKVSQHEIRVSQTKELLRSFGDKAPEVSTGESKKPVRLYDRCAPAVTLVRIMVEVSLEYPEPTMNMQKWSETLERMTTLIEQKKLPATSWEFATFLLADIEANIQQYVSLGDKFISTKVSDSSEGTGFIVTSDGWLVTNSHVVLPDNEEKEKILIGELNSGLRLYSLDSWIQSNFPNIYGLAQPRLNVIHDALIEGVFRKIRKDTKFGTMDRECSVWVIKYGPNYTPEKTNWRARLVAYGESLPGRDVAVLKMDRGTFPFLTLGDDARLAPGDPILVMGYPGGGTFQETVLNTRIAPLLATLTSGIVSALKPSRDSKWRWIQTDAALYHGSSGGPAFDRTGAVVGVVTMISRGKSGQEIMPGMNFCLPVSVVKKLLDDFKVTYTKQDYSISE